LHLGFTERKTKGSHRVFYRKGIDDIINLQPARDGKAKPYQVKQIRAIVKAYDLWNPGSYSIILVWSEEDQAFIATVPELDGCTAHGETRAEAIREIEIAIENWLDTAREIGREIPAPKHWVDYETQIEAGAQEDLKNAMRAALAENAPALVSSSGVGVWTQLDWHTFVYTNEELFSDLSGN